MNQRSATDSLPDNGQVKRSFCQNQLQKKTLLMQTLRVGYTTREWGQAISLCLEWHLSVDSQLYSPWKIKAENNKLKIISL